MLFLSRPESERHLAVLRDALYYLHKGRSPHPPLIAWPADLNRSILRQLPLQKRTWNCIVTAKLMDGNDALTVGDLLQLRNFGRVSLQDLLFSLESFLQDCVRNNAPEAPRDAAPDSAPGGGGIPGPWDALGDLLKPLLSAAAEFHGAETPADIFDPQTKRLADIMGIAAQVEAVRIDDLVDDGHRLSSRAARKTAQLYESLSESQRTVIDHRIVGSPPKTLSKIGSFLGLTRERVRQIQVRMEKQIDIEIGAELHMMTAAAKDQLGHIAAETAVDEYLRALLPETTPGGMLFRQLLAAELGYAKQNGVCLDETAARVLEGIRVSMNACVDDAGLVNEEQIMEKLPAKGEWRSRWPLLRKCLVFHDLFGSLSLRDSAKARTKAALLSIGRPATANEIAAIGGVTPRQVSSCMSNFPSIVRVDKSRWGLADWTDEGYRGIVDEIMQRIDKGGGVADVSEIIEEIPRKFHVKETSVRGYLQTLKFAVRNGYVTLADKAAIPRRPLDEVIDGRDKNGAPYWTFKVEARYFRGYSLTGVPSEFAQAFGCKPESVVWVRVSDPDGCRDLSIRWNLASLVGGATIGYLTEPLRRLGVKPGDRVRITIEAAGAAALSPEPSETPRRRGRSPKTFPLAAG